MCVSNSLPSHERFKHKEHIKAFGCILLFVRVAGQPGVTLMMMSCHVKHKLYFNFAVVAPGTYPSILA